MKRILRMAAGAVAAVTVASVAGGIGAANAATVTPPATPPPGATIAPAYAAPAVVTGSPVASKAPVAAGQGTYTLAAGTKAVQAGDVLVVNAAGGQQSVVRVTGVTTSAGVQTVQTQSTSALYALGPGTFSGSATPASAPVMKLADGTSVKPQVTLGGTLRYAAVEQITCGTGTATVTGSISLTPSVTVDGSVSWHWYGPSLDYAEIVGGVNESASLSVQTTGTSSGSTCSKSTTIGSLSWDVPIGPIDATVKLSLTADGKASFTGATSTTVGETFSGSAGIRYDSSGLHTVHTASSSFTHSISGAGSANFEAGISTGIGVSFYDVVSGDLDLRAYAGVSVTPASIPAWRLYAGVQLNGDIKILGYSIVSGTIWNQQWTLLTPPGITTTALPVAHPGLPYSAAVAAAYGTGPYTWSFCCFLPTGLTFHNGVISGTVPAGTAAGTQEIFVQVTDANGFTAGRFLDLPVASLQISTGSLAATADTAYNGVLTATGASGTVTWSGTAPDGLHLASSGLVSGTPSAPGTFSFVAKAVDAAGQVATKTITVTVAQHYVCNIHVCTIEP